MPHVDEGTLHALLDGALEAGDPDRAAAVRAHLASCDDCAARLVREAALRDRADAVLSALEPEAVEADFAEVLIRAGRGAAASDPDAADAPVDRAGAAGRRRDLARSVRWTRRLAWAATVVVALGTGYLMGERFGFPAPGRAPRTATSEAAPRAAAAATTESQDRALPAEMDAGSLPPAQEPQAAKVAPVRAPAGGQEAAPVRQPGAEQEAAPVRERGARQEAPPPGRAAEAAPGAQADASREEAAAAAPAPEREQAKALPAEGAPGDSVAAAFSRGVALNAIVVTGMADQARDASALWRPATPAEAARLLGVPVLRLPGAVVEDLAALGWAAASPVRSTQRLAGGVLVTVTQLPAAWGTAPASADSVPGAVGGGETPGQARVVVTRDDGTTLVVRGPLPPEELLRLGRRAEPPK